MLKRCMAVPKKEKSLKGRETPFKSAEGGNWRLGNVKARNVFLHSSRLLIDSLPNRRGRIGIGVLLAQATKALFVGEVLCTKQ